MTRLRDQCPTCKGARTVPHVRRVLLEGELPNPNDLDRYKVDDICPACGGEGKRLVDVEITEPPKQTAEEPYYGC